MIDGIDHYWIWIALGLLLAVLELLVPGVYLIWLAVAALVTGALAFVLPFGWPLEIVSFVSLSLIAVYSARRYLNDKPIVSSDPLLNQRGGRMVGETALVVQPIESGSGRVRLGDSEWIARGPDTPAGQRVRISGNDGAILLVEPIPLIAETNAQDTDGTPAEG
ncbi:NfeD family protein [Citromicrobium bathyomarinum]